MIYNAYWVARQSYSLDDSNKGIGSGIDFAYFHYILSGQLGSSILDDVDSCQAQGQRNLAESVGGCSFLQTLHIFLGVF